VLSRTNITDLGTEVAVQRPRTICQSTPSS
jgi:hypothetical protein